MGLNGVLRYGDKVSFNDQEHRKKVIEEIKKFKEWTLESNEYQFMIDLNFINHPLYVAAEIEQGQWVGNYWLNFLNSNFLRNGNPPISHKTINIPPRKQHYWINGDHYFQNGKYAGLFWYTETNANSNIFIRTNEDVTQIIIVYPDVITNDRKVVRSLKKSSGITTGYQELWTGIKPEDCETWNYNKENNLWELYIYKEKKLIQITDELREKLKSAI